MFGTLFDDAFLPSFLFCFIFLFFVLLNPRPFVQSFFDSRYVCAPAASRNICSVYFFFLWGSLIFRFYMDSTLRVFLPIVDGLLCAHGLDFDISLCDNSINQTRVSSRMCAPEIISLAGNYTV